MIGCQAYSGKKTGKSDVARIGLSITRKPPAASAQYKVVQDEVRISLGKVGKRTATAYNRIVQNWRDKPKFSHEVGSGPKRLFLRVKIGGSAKAIRNWTWIDKTGVKAHTIRPKKAGGFLRFVWGGPGSYDAKTKPSPARFGGSGKVQSGQVVFRRQVKHPGFKARGFSTQINKDVKPELDKEIENGLKRGLKRAKGN